MSATLLLLLLLFSNNGFFSHVHSFNEARFELIHRHSPQLSGTGRNLGPPQNALERIKQLVHSDNARQKMILQRLGLRRRMTFEVFESNGGFMEIPMRSAADFGLGQYFVSFRVGSPPKKFVLIADTGSDLTWMKCNYKCLDCLKNGILQKGTGRIFHANLSPSFKTIPCWSQMCKVDLAGSFALSLCPTPTSPCAYDYEYADGSNAMGFFANETVRVGLDNGRKVNLHDVVIGCSESVRGISISETDGVMGLGYSKHSFAVKAADKFGNKFSYCLVDHLSPSNFFNYLSFGGNTSSKNMQYTELVLGILIPFYAVNLAGISINGVMLKIPTQVWNVDSSTGVIMDSGSSLTFLVQPAYEAVMIALKTPLMRFKKLELNLGPLEYCFAADQGFEESLVPKLGLHFADGVEFVPPVKSYVIDAGVGVKCLGFASVEWPGISVIGNILQQNHLWEFDIVEKRLGFAPSTCSVLNSKH